jgi:dCMP deaminase
MDIKIDWAIDMARHVAKLSKDPSTKVGAVIFDRKGRIVSAGFNGLARGVRDTDARLNNRDLKLRMVLHAERNAISFATAPLDGCIIVVTHPCCAQCAASLIQSGITHVIYPAPTLEFRERWREDYVLAQEQFREAGVKVTEVQV